LHRLTRVRVDDFRIEVVFPDHRAVLGLDALHRDAGAHDFRKTVNVDGVEAGARFDVLAHAPRPGFGTEDADPQRRGLGIHALTLHFLHDVAGVRRRHHDHPRPEIADQLYLLPGLPPRHGNHRAAQTFGPIMRAQAAGEQAVAVSHMNDVARPPAARPDRAGHEIGPGVDVALGV